MDIFDRASEQEQRFRDQALAAQAARVPRGASAVCCQAPDCGVPIPQARRDALPGVQLCVDCQDLKEKLHR